MQPCPDPRRRLILAHLENAPNCLDLGAGTPSRDKGARERCVREADREGIGHDALCARWG